METLFENHYVRDKQIAKEIYKYYYFQRKLLVACYVFLSLSFFANVFISIFEEAYNLFILIFVPLFFLFQFYCYFRQVNMMIKRDQEVYGKEISVETIVTNEYIQCSAATGAVNKLEYDRIKSAAQTKNLILLRTKANLVYILKKDSFTKGTKDDFITFLNNKGIKVR